MEPAPADCALFTGSCIHTASHIIPIAKFRVSYAVTIHASIIRSLYGNGQGMVIGSYFHHYDGISLVDRSDPDMLGPTDLKHHVDTILIREASASCSTS
jgi:hypothetical protein